MPAALSKAPVADDSDDESATPAEIKTALERYSRAVEHRLKPGLDAACELRDKAFEQLAELDQTSKALDVIDAAAGGKAHEERTVETDESGLPLPAMQTRVNIGEEFYMQAHIHKLDRIVVDVGLGIMVEMSRMEARQFVQNRKEMLETLAAKHTKRIAEVQAHLKTVMRSLSQLRIAASATDFMEGRSMNYTED